MLNGLMNYITPYQSQKNYKKIISQKYIPGTVIHTLVWNMTNCG